MKKVKITVLKTTLDQELALEYGAQGLGRWLMEPEVSFFTMALGFASPAWPFAAATTACVQ